MKNRTAPNVSLAIVVFAAVATVALRVAARRREPRLAPGTEPAPVTATAGQSRPLTTVTTVTTVTTGTQGGVGRELPGLPGPPGRPARAVEQMQHVFHELHADGHNPLCAVCDGKYGSA